MQLTISNFADGSSSGTLDVSANVFEQKFNEPLIHQVVTAYMAGARAGTHAQKTRSEVSGGGRKPWRQKGTGRARAGSIRSPLWRSGGVIFAAKPRDYQQKVNRKMYRGALRSIFSELFRQNRLIVVDEIIVNEPKTRSLVAQLKQLGLNEVLIISDNVDENLYFASRNLYKVGLQEVEDINPASLIAFEKILMTKAAVKQVEEWLA